jgi:hypothetical protein
VLGMRDNSSGLASAMTKLTPRQRLDNLEAALVEDILALSDDELYAELKENGQLAIELALADVEIETLRKVADILARCTSLEEAVLSVQVSLGVALAEADGETDDVDG